MSEEMNYVIVDNDGNIEVRIFSSCELAKKFFSQAFKKYAPEDASLDVPVDDLGKDVEQAFTKKIAFFDEVRIIVGITRVDDCSIL